MQALRLDIAAFRKKETQAERSLHEVQAGAQEQEKELQKVLTELQQVRDKLQHANSKLQQAHSELKTSSGNLRESDRQRDKEREVEAAHVQKVKTMEEEVKRLKCIAQ